MVAVPGASRIPYLFDPPWAPKAGDLYTRVSFGVNMFVAAGNASVAIWLKSDVSPRIVGIPGVSAERSCFGHSM